MVSWQGSDEMGTSSHVQGHKDGTMEKQNQSQVSICLSNRSILFPPELADSWAWNPVSLIESRMTCHLSSDFEDIGECNVRVSIA